MSRFNCKVVEAIPIYIIKEKSNSFFLVSKIRNEEKQFVISENMLNEFLKKYNYYERSFLGCKNTCFEIVYDIEDKK